MHQRIVDILRTTRLPGLAFALLVVIVVATPATAATPTTTPGLYVVDGVRTSLERSAVAATGAAIVEVDHASVVVSASASDLRRLRALRHPVSVLQAPPPAGAEPAARSAFPVADAAFHTYAELSDETAAIAGAYPSIVSRQSIGTSYEGRTIWALKVSDNVGVDEAEPEVLFTHNQHAREHLTVEMAMYLLGELTSKYASDARIKNAVDTREIWIVPTVNPDGSEFDVATGAYAGWRKNRQPNAGSAFVGTDLNRNWSFAWGCCGGSSTDPSSETYRGLAPFSAPETTVLGNFVTSRRIGGVQQITVGIDFHSYGEQILWPYGYTLDDTTTTLNADQRDTFAALAHNMAGTNGYTPEQASDLYIADGALDDWMWGAEGIFGYTFEMYPASFNPGFYPPDEVIPAQTSRNREAVLRLLEIADCPYRAIGKQAQYCAATPAGGGAPPPPPVAPPPPPVVAPPPPPPPPPPVPASRIAVATMLSTRATVSAAGDVRLRVRCRAETAARCAGAVVLRARLRPGARAAVLARRTLSLRAGTRTVRLRLRSVARRALRSRRSIAATATVTTVRAGRAAVARTSRVTLHRRR